LTVRTLTAWVEDRRIGEFTETPQADGSSLFSFDLAKRIERLWNDRVKAFLSEPAALTRKRRPTGH
jgi:hypothetical protein